MKLFYQYMTIFFNFSPTLTHLLHYKSRIATAIRDVLWMKMTMANSDFKGLISPGDEFGIVTFFCSPLTT